MVGDLLTAEINEKQARSIKGRLTSCCVLGKPSSRIANRGL
jgi:hypothetical protein